MALINQFGERWARNSENIERVLGSRKGGQGVYVLYDGSTPVYIGKGNIRQRLREADKDKRRRHSWDRFSWYVIADPSLIHDVEVLSIRTLPLYLRYLTRQRGHFRGARSTKSANKNTALYRSPEVLQKTAIVRRNRPC